MGRLSRTFLIIKCALVVMTLFTASYHVYRLAFPSHTAGEQSAHGEHPAAPRPATKAHPQDGARVPSSEILSVALDNITALLQKAKEIHAETGLVLFTIINDAFLDFAASWCCNTAHFGDVHRHVLFLTTDLPTARRLKSWRPAVTVAAVDMRQFRGPMEFSQVDYVRLMVERTRFILHLLKAGVRVLLFEVDSVWLRNPLPLLRRRQSQGDILATGRIGSGRIAGCFLFLNPTAATLKVWQRLTDMMDQLEDSIRSYEREALISFDTNDQEYLAELVETKYAGVQVVYLPTKTFPDGQWYDLPTEERRKYRPYLINNNWIIGTTAKRTRAKVRGHWFWNEMESKCISPQAKE